MAQLPQHQPILYSFRRCPYAIRARLAVFYSGQACELREVVLKDKPQALLDASSKATVPVLVKPDGSVLDESLLIMQWALQHNDQDGWLARGNIDHPLIERNDHFFKYYLDRYKYFDRYPQASQQDYLDKALEFIDQLEQALSQSTNNNLCLLDQLSIVDMAILPFVRQFAFVDKQRFDQLPYKNVQAWLNNFLSSTLFSAVMDKYPAWQLSQEPLIFSAKA